MADTRNVLSGLEMEDLQEQHREIAEVIGLEAFKKLVEAFGGGAIYIPQQKEVIKNRVYRLVSEEYDGSNIKTLCVRYGISVTKAYDIVREQLQKGRKIEIPGQMSITDYL